MCLIQRQYTQRLVCFVRNHPYFGFMAAGIASGSILPCLRKNEIHFYECGARLFSFSETSVTTHKRYLGEDAVPRKAYRTLRNNEWTFERFCEIRQTATRHRNMDPPNNDADVAVAHTAANELATVHSLFPAFSVTRKKSKPGDLALIDVEARFDRCQRRDLAKSMIDLVFFMPNGFLLFVEAKGLWHRAVQSRTIAKVEEQVNRYQTHIAHRCVLEALNCSISAQSALLDTRSRHASKVFSRVPILLLGDGNPGPNNHWLQERLNNAHAWTVETERPLVIDGRRDPVGAIRAFVERFGS